MALRIERVAMQARERERLYATGRAGPAPSRLAGFLDWLGNASLAALLLLFAFAAAAAVWLRLIGRSGQAGPELVWIVVAALALGTVWASARAGWRARDVRLRRERVFGPSWRDAEAGEVEEEHYDFLEAASVREAETGTLIHLLRVDERRCLVVFDEESFRLVEQGGDPAATQWRPRTRAVLRRAPRSRRVLSLRFGGEALTSEPSQALGWATPGWEWDGKIWELEWPEIARRLAGAD
ncbi:hypothetical protein A7A76_18210 [Lysobacter enzymogenes]|uniref:hypothetical protein n=1 Tax=Lysobacter enzymogenes TaxID=69 RepID=UPI0019D2576D|nr:hypothetical protein [Lysobacter enzymogenes]MBN7136687.1 hypothetical protein [Lysobacter enzymogenes]